MGKVQGSMFEPDFNRSVKVQFTDQRITSNAGVLLLRQADSNLDMTCSMAAKMIDTRDQDAIRDPLGDLLRERVYAMAIGHSAQGDVDRLAHDPAFGIAVWNRSGESVIDERLASQPTQSQLLKMMATHSTNINALIMPLKLRVSSGQSFLIGVVRFARNQSFSAATTWPPRFVQIAPSWTIEENALIYREIDNGILGRLSLPNLKVQSLIA